MSVAYRSQSSTTYATSTNTVLAAPAGLANGDILIAMSFRGNVGSAPAVTAPTGFTQIGTEISFTDASNFIGKISLFWKRAASESGSYTFTHASCSAEGLLMAFSGAVASGSPIDARSQNSSTTATTATATGITTTQANEFLLWLEQNWGATAGTTPTGWTSIYNQTPTNLFMAATNVQATAGATGNVSTTAAGSAGFWSAYLIALLAASTAVPNAPVITSATANSNSTVTVVGTSDPSVTINVGDPGALGTTTATSGGAWTFTTATLANGNYTFTATATNANGTSAVSNSKSATVDNLTVSAVVTPASAPSGTTRNITVTPSGGVAPFTFSTPTGTGLTFTPVSGSPGQWTFVF